MRAGGAVPRVAEEPVLAGRGRDVAVTAAVPPGWLSWRLLQRMDYL